MKDMWEERYAAAEYAYGEEPNASPSRRCSESSLTNPAGGAAVSARKVAF